MPGTALVPESRPGIRSPHRRGAHTATGAARHRGGETAPVVAAEDERQCSRNSGQFDPGGMLACMALLATSSVG